MRRLSVLIALLIALGAGLFYAEQWSFFAPGPQARHGRGTAVWIKSGERSGAIAQQLQNAGIVRNGALFRFGVTARGKTPDLKAGEYVIPSRASMADVMGILIAGKSIQHKITAAEGLTSRMIYEIVRKDPALVGDAGPEPAEGSLLPETYFFTRGMSRHEILTRMRKAQSRFLAKAWAHRAGNLPFGSPRDAITLASIVEKETAIPEERKHIAAVFMNRLRLGMKLQSDPTIIYGLTKGYPLGRGIRESELQSATPYNTYNISGLPPTPICNPGKESIAAVLQPENSSDLYFVASGTGGHVFTPSVAEHEKNVAKWRRIEKTLKIPTQAFRPLAGPASPIADTELRPAGGPDPATNTQPPPVSGRHTRRPRHIRHHHRQR
jgi:UPF0755 protein